MRLDTPATTTAAPTTTTSTTTTSTTTTTTTLAPVGPLLGSSATEVLGDTAGAAVQAAFHGGGTEVETAADPLYAGIFATRYGAAGTQM